MVIEGKIKISGGNRGKNKKKISWVIQEKISDVIQVKIKKVYFLLKGILSSNRKKCKKCKKNGIKWKWKRQDEIV